MQPEVPPLPGNVPPVNYPAYTPPPPPPSGTSTWVWVLVGCLGGGFLIIIVFAAMLVPVFSQARARARAVSCLSNVKQIGLGTMMYAEDYDQRLPIAATWQTGIDPYIKNRQVFHCPAALGAPYPSASPGTNYAYNSALDMMKVKRIANPAMTVSTYDSTSVEENAHDALTSLPSPGRHTGRNSVGFADGHAQFWPDAEPLTQGEILPDTP
ncbi:MAG: hypothetical protein JWL77_1146 [Chthonomonadaceae bacterium]|nr:hypothetical protein [Chthonomonadaceae bacterium]